MCFWGNIKTFHSAKFRFILLHVYIHDLLKLGKINLPVLNSSLPTLGIYISPSKLKPKLHGLASLFFLPKENCPLEYMIWCLFYNKTAYFA